MHKSEEFLSIVIITCNRQKELKKAIESCYNFVGMDCEIIVVDNNSNDKTKEMLNNLEPPDCVTMRTFFMDSNLGVAGARNFGFNKAKSNVVYFLDDDAYFADNSESLYFGYKYLLDNKNLFAIGTEIADIKKKRFLKDLTDKINSNRVYTFIGASHFIRKDYVKTKDLYPKNLYYGAEELYASLCAYKNGYYIEHKEEIKIIHDPSVQTRLSEYENDRNIYVNGFVIRKLTFPKTLMVFSYIMFFLRLNKITNKNIKEILLCYQLYKQRMNDNKYAIYRINLKVFLNLGKRFGYRSVL